MRACAAAAGRCCCCCCCRRRWGEGGVWSLEQKRRRRGREGRNSTHIHTHTHTHTTCCQLFVAWAGGRMWEGWLGVGVAKQDRGNERSVGRSVGRLVARRKRSGSGGVGRVFSLARCLCRCRCHHHHRRRRRRLLLLLCTPYRWDSSSYRWHSQSEEVYRTDRAGTHTHSSVRPLVLFFIIIIITLILCSLLLCCVWLIASVCVCVCVCVCLSRVFLVGHRGCNQLLRAAHLSSLFICALSGGSTCRKGFVMFSPKMQRPIRVNEVRTTNWINFC